MAIIGSCHVAMRRGKFYVYHQYYSSVYFSIGRYFSESLTNICLDVDTAFHYNFNIYLYTYVDIYIS